MMKKNFAKNVERILIQAKTRLNRKARLNYSLSLYKICGIVIKVKFALKE